MKKGSYLRTKEFRKKISESRKGEKNPMFGKHLSKKAKRKISESLKGKIPKNTLKWKGENHPNWKGGKIKKICQICGKEFLGYFSQKNRYCSKKCFWKSKIGKHPSEESRKKMSEAQKKIGKKPPSNKGKTYEELYGKEKAELVKRKIGEAHKGEKCHFWKGGNPINRNKHMGTDYHKWRTAIFVRDNWTCQTCQKRGENIQAHHIKSWAKFPELRYEIDNGVTLCKESCHRLANKEQNKYEKMA